MDGDGAVRLIAYDAGRRALLLERADPGTPLKELEPDRGLDVFVDLFPRLWKPAGAPFRTLADEAASWAGSLPGDYERAGRPFERALLDAALEAIDALGGSQGEQVLVNQDMHADNVVVAAHDQPSRNGVRLDRPGGEAVASVDRERARGWALAQTIAWAFDGDEADPAHVEIARWLWEAGR